MIAYINHYTLVTFLFSSERENGLDSRGDGRELGGVERGTTEMNIYHVRKKNLFGIKRKGNLKNKVALFILLNFDCNVSLFCKDCVIT